MPKKIPFELFKHIQFRMKQKSNNIYYKISSNIDLESWYTLDTNVLVEPIWCLNFLKIFGNNFETMVK